MDLQGLTLNAGFPRGTVFTPGKMIDYQAGAVVSKTIVKSEKGTITIFAFSKGQGLSEHSAPFDALVQVVEGQGQVTINGVEHVLVMGQAIMMPANIPHSVHAVEDFKMMLTMIRG